MKKYVEQHWIAFTGVIILIYCLLLSLQGFDFKDEGYVLVGYQNFFDDHLYARHLNGYYLTGLIGGIWEKLFGAGGWYSFRILNCLIILGGYVTICYTLRDYWHKKWWIFTGFALVLTNFITQHGVMVFHYYTFNAFMNCILALILYYSYKENNNKLLFLSSLLLGINIFIRLPNIMLCVIPFILSCIVYYYDRDRKAFYKQLGVIIGGVFTGIFLSLFLIYGLNHFESYFNSFRDYSNTAQNSNNSHGIISMMKTYLDNYLSIFIYITIFAIFFSGLFFFSKIKLLKKNRKLFYCIIIFFSLCLGRFLFTTDIILYPRNTLLYSLSFILSFYIIYRERENKTGILLMAILILISIFQPVGSDFGIGNMGPYSLWGLLPASLAIALSDVKNNHPSKFNLKPYVIVINTIVVFLVISLMKNNLQYCKNDNGLRIDKTYTVRSLPRLSILTSKQRAEEMDSIMNISKNFIKEGDITFFAPDIPAWHYLTQTKPYLVTPWIDITSIGKIDELFESAKKTNLLPKIIVRKMKKIYVRNSYDYQVQYNNKALDAFIQNNDYKTIWNNGNYKIYKLNY